MRRKIQNILVEITAWIVALTIFGACTAIIVGCSPKTIEHIQVKTDTCYIQKWQRDSIYINDSIYVVEKQTGDTVRITTDRWHTRWRDRIVRDTAYISKTDTVKVSKTIEKPIPFKEKASLFAAGIIAAFLMVLFLAALRKT